MRDMRNSYDLTKIIAMTAYQETAPFPRPMSSIQLRKYLVITNFCWLVGLITICYTTFAVAKFAWTQRAERVAEAEHSQALQDEINRLAELHQYTAAQTMQLAKTIQGVLDTTDGSQRRFLTAILPEALRLQTLYKIPVSATIGMAIYESGWGTSPLAKENHNYFGMKALGDDWAGDTVVRNTKDLGQRTLASFRSFPDMKSGLEGYATFLRTKDRYAKAFELRNGAKFVETIAKAGYCPDSNYAISVEKIISRYKLGTLDLPEELPTTAANPTSPRLTAQLSDSTGNVQTDSLTNPANPTSIETARN